MPVLLAIEQHPDLAFCLGLLVVVASRAAEIIRALADYQRARRDH